MFLSVLSLPLVASGCVGSEKDFRERLFAHGECMVIEGELDESDATCRGSAARCLARGVELVGASPQDEFTGRDCSELLPNGMKFTGGPCDVLMGAHCAKLDALGMSLTMKTTTLLESCVWYDLRKRDVVSDQCQSDPATSAECAVLYGVFDRLQECFDERGPQRFPDGECFQIFRSAFWTAPEATQECEVCPWWSSKECFEAAAGLDGGTGG
jgi:hypothetical protein